MEDKSDANFIDGSALKAVNKCRNPIRDSSGPYCYAYTPWESVTISKQYCPIRKCRSSGNQLRKRTILTNILFRRTRIYCI